MMMISLKPIVGHGVAGRVPEKASLAPRKAISASAFQPSQLPSVSFGNNDDPSNQPLFLSDDSMLRAVVFEGKDPVSFAQKAKKSFWFKLSAHPKYVIERNYKRFGHTANPFLLIYAYSTAWLGIFDPKGYVDQFKNRNNALEKRIASECFYKAHLHGTINPAALLKQGNVMGALKSFAKAIETDCLPGYRYNQLGEFVQQLIEYRDEIRRVQDDNSSLPIDPQRDSPRLFQFKAGLKGMKKETLITLQSEIIGLETRLGVGGLEKLAKEAFEKAARFPSGL